MTREIFYISWLNSLGGFEYWPFTGYKDHLLSIEATGETNRNIFPQWPKSYGANADTITKQTFRKSKKQKIVRSQVLNRQQAEDLGEGIKTSVLVQIVTTRKDRRTVIVDNSSFVVRKEMDKLHSLSFTITYTDEYAVQHV